MHKHTECNTYICAVHAPLEGGFWYGVGRASQDFVFAVFGAVFGQAGDHRLP